MQNEQTSVPRKRRVKNTWVKWRHRLVFGFFRPFFRLSMRRKYGYTYEKYHLKYGEPHIILSNHQTKADQFMGGLIFNTPLYYIARIDLFLIPIVSTLLKFLVAPIPKNKAIRDMRCIRSSVQVVKEGGNILMCPEGNLTCSGTTEYIDASTAKLVQLLKVPLVFLNITGGYGVCPRWANKPRRGKTHGRVTKVLQYDQYKNLTSDELLALIKRELYVDDVSGNIEIYKSPRRAEYAERVLYVCKKCGFAQFKSHKNTVTCCGCGTVHEYTETLGFKKVDGAGNYDSADFANMSEWYRYQNRYVSKLNMSGLPENVPLFTDFIKTLRAETGRRKTTLLKKAVLQLYPDKLLFTPMKKGAASIEFLLSDITGLALYGKNLLSVSAGNKTFFIKAEKRFNALKYVQICQHYINERTQVHNTGTDEEFLGL